MKKKIKLYLQINNKLKKNKKIIYQNKVKSMMKYNNFNTNKRLII